MADDPTIEELMQNLEDLLDQVHTLEEIIREDNVALYERGDEIERQIAELREEQKGLGDRIQEASPKLLEDLNDAKFEAARAEKAIKSFCHNNLTKDQLAKTNRFAEGRIRVRVSKAQFHTSYKTEALLRAHPELEDMFVDGDPVVGRTINEAVLERLIRRGDLDDDAMKEFRETVKVRNPSVSVEEVVDAAPE